MDLRPLRRHRDYRFLYAAQFVSFLGRMITYVALPWQAYRLTHSSLAVGLLGLAELLPLVVTAFVGGVLADSVDRRRMVILTEVGLLGGCGLLMLNAAATRPKVAALYVAAALMSGLHGLQRPKLDALTPRLVDENEIPAAAPLSSSGTWRQGRWPRFSESGPPWSPAASSASSACWSLASSCDSSATTCAPSRRRSSPRRRSSG